jgi:hypothetical protein
MNITREGPVRIGIKDIERAWRKRAKDARHIITDSERPGLTDQPPETGPGRMLVHGWPVG